MKSFLVRWLTVMMQVVGLGNIGSGYTLTRHNVGKLFVGHFAERNNSVLSLSVKSAGKIAELRLPKGKRALLFQPLGLMNIIGVNVAREVRRHSVPHEHIIVVHDDLE